MTAARRRRGTSRPQQTKSRAPAATVATLSASTGVNPCHSVSATGPAAQDGGRGRVDEAAADEAGQGARRQSECRQQDRPGQHRRPGIMRRAGRWHRPAEEEPQRQDARDRHHGGIDEEPHRDQDEGELAPSIFTS